MTRSRRSDAEPGEPVDPQLWHRHLKLNLDMCFVTGICIPSLRVERMSPWRRRLYGIFQDATDVICCLTTCSQILGLLQLRNFKIFLLGLVHVVHGLQGTGKAMVVRSKRKLLVSYADNWNKILLENEKNPIDRTSTFQTLHKKDLNMGRTLLKVEFALLFVSLTFFFFPELYQLFRYPEPRRLITLGYIPVDMTATLTLMHMTNLSETVIWFIINFKAASCDAFFQSLIILHTSQFRHLKRLQDVVFQGVFEPQNRVLGPAKNLQVERKLRWWVKLHQDTIIVTRQLKEIYSPALFFAYIECIMEMVLVVSFLTGLEVPWSIIQRICAVIIVGLAFAQVYIMCRLGDNLQDMSNSVTDPGFTTKLFQSSRKIQRNMIIIFQRMHFPIKFSAVGLFYMSSKSFTGLVQGVFSYYMALRQLQERLAKK